MADDDTMTLRDVAELIGYDDPLACLMGVLQLLRSIHQGEAATDEGCYGSCIVWTEQHGKPTAESVRHYVEVELASVADLPIPNEKVVEYIVCDDEPVEE